jgi:hypothetical protein
MSTVSRLYRRRIGEILVNEGIISTEQLDQALELQKKNGELLGELLMDLGYVNEADIAKTICLQYQLPFLTLENYLFDDKQFSVLPKEFVLAHKLLPFDKIGNTLLVLVTEIPSDKVLSEIPKLTQLNVALYVGMSSEVNKYLNNLTTGRPKAGAKPPAAAKPAAAKAAKAEPAAGVVSVRTIIDDDEDAEDSTGVVDEGQEDAALVFGQDKESFLEELDSSWASIFPDPKPKIEPKVDPKDEPKGKK